MTVALVGNPNTGKSTLFTVLAGVRQRIGNYPGVTVEKKIGHMQHAGRQWAVVDLPGTYSLAPHSLDEMVVVDVLLGRRNDVPKCDAIICIVDASNLERNLYLVSQVLEVGLPTVVALNMTDIAAARGLAIDAKQLSQRLGVPVVPVQANKRRGLNELRKVLADVAERPASSPATPFPPVFCQEVSELETWLNEANGESKTTIPRYLVERLLLDTGGYLEQSGVIHTNGHQHNGSPTLKQQLQAARLRLLEAGYPVPAVEAMVRYDWAARQLNGVIQRPQERSETLTDKIDRVLTHKLWGSVVFAAMMFLMFSSIFIFARPVMDWIQSGIDAISAVLKNHMAEGALRSLLADGILGGVGQRDRISAANSHSVFLHRHVGRLRLHGPGRISDGQVDGPRGAERQVVHSAVVVVCLRDSGHHGHAGDRKPPRSVDDDHGGAADELFGPACRCTRC